MRARIDELRLKIKRLEADALSLKREAFDAGFHQAHCRLAECESEARNALNALLSDPPIGHQLRGTAQ